MRRTGEHTAGVVRALLPTPRPLYYRCGTCGAGFATRSHLDTHLHHAYHGFQCLICGVVYATNGALQAHARRAHEQGRTERPLHTQPTTGDRRPATPLGSVIPFPHTARPR